MNSVSERTSPKRKFNQYSKLKFINILYLNPNLKLTAQI